MYRSKRWEKRRPGKKLRVVYGTVVCLIFAAGLVLNRTKIYRAITPPIQHDSAGNELYYVRKVIDGDTIILFDHQKVRLIGIDCPERFESDKLLRDASRSGLNVKEITALGQRSYEFARVLCESQSVRLEFDRDKYDRYGRLLAFVFLSDGRMLNEELIKNGYALAYLRFDFNEQYQAKFRQAQQYARAARKGLWSASPGLDKLDPFY